MKVQTEDGEVEVDAVVVDSTGGVIAITRAISNPNARRLSHVPTGYGFWSAGFTSLDDARIAATRFWGSLSEEEKAVLAGRDIGGIQRLRPGKRLRQAHAFADVEFGADPDAVGC